MTSRKNLMFLAIRCATIDGCVLKSRVASSPWRPISLACSRLSDSGGERTSTSKRNRAGFGGGAEGESERLSLTTLFHPHLL